MGRESLDETEAEELRKTIKALFEQSKAFMECGGSPEIYHLVRNAENIVGKFERFSIHKGAAIGLGCALLTAGFAFGQAMTWEEKVKVGDRLKDIQI